MSGASFRKAFDEETRADAGDLLKDLEAGLRKAFDGKTRSDGGELLEDVEVKIKGRVYVLPKGSAVHFPRSNGGRRWYDATIFYAPEGTMLAKRRTGPTIRIMPEGKNKFRAVHKSVRGVRPIGDSVRMGAYHAAGYSQRLG